MLAFTHAGSENYSIMLSSDFCSGLKPVELLIHEKVNFYLFDFIRSLTPRVSELHYHMAISIRGRINKDICFPVKPCWNISHFAPLIKTGATSAAQVKPPAASFLTARR